jgi:hypothetical protein
MVTISTTSPDDLLKRFRKAIDDGHVVTWKYYSDGDFTHTPPQWTGKAYMRPSTESGKLKFNIIKAASTGVDMPVYAVFHGRLIESFIEHFFKSFTNGYGSAQPQAGDVVS